MGELEGLLQKSEGWNHIEFDHVDDRAMELLVLEAGFRDVMHQLLDGVASSEFSFAIESCYILLGMSALFSREQQVGNSVF